MAHAFHPIRGVDPLMDAAARNFPGPVKSPLILVVGSGGLLSVDRIPGLA